jgi:hypothetical protein
VSNMRCDYLAANQLGRALYAPLFESPEQPPNSARFTFLNPTAPEFFLDWEKAAKDLVATLRSQAGRNPYDRSSKGRWRGSGSLSRGGGHDISPCPRHWQL